MEAKNTGSQPEAIENEQSGTLLLPGLDLADECVRKALDNALEYLQKQYSGIDPKDAETVVKFLIESRLVKNVSELSLSPPKSSRRSLRPPHFSQKASLILNANGNVTRLLVHPYRSYTIPGRVLRLKHLDTIELHDPCESSSDDWFNDHLPKRCLRLFHFGELSPIPNLSRLTHLSLCGCDWRFASRESSRH